MIYFLPKLYGTAGSGCESFRFVKVKKFYNDSLTSAWQRVTKIGFGFYVAKGKMFLDWNQMFHQLDSSSKP